MIPRSGKAQKGCSILVIWSPYARAIIDLGIETPSLVADSIIIGPWIAHCPPPLGTKIFTNPALIKVKIGNATKARKTENIVKSGKMGI